MGSIPVRVTKTKGHSLRVSFCFADALRARTHSGRSRPELGSNNSRVVSSGDLVDAASSRTGHQKESTLRCALFFVAPSVISPIHRVPSGRGEGYSLRAHRDCGGTSYVASPIAKRSRSNRRSLTRASTASLRLIICRRRNSRKHLIWGAFSHQDKHTPRCQMSICL